MTDDAANYALYAKFYNGPPSIYLHLTKDECAALSAKMGERISAKGFVVLNGPDGVSICPESGGLCTPQPQLAPYPASVECLPMPDQRGQQ